MALVDMDASLDIPAELAQLKANIFALLSDKNTYMEDDAPGLGLSICKAIVDRTGGKMGASDNTEDGRGTIVWFWAPTEILL